MALPLGGNAGNVAIANALSFVLWSPMTFSYHGLDSESIMNHSRTMRKKMTAKEALADYRFRLSVQADLGCSMNTIVACLRGVPTRQMRLRGAIRESLAARGVDLKSIGDGHAK